MTFSFIGMPGGYEWFVILVIALLLFGKKLPEVARSMGNSVSEFKKGIKGAENEVEEINDSIREIEDKKEQK